MRHNHRGLHDLTKESGTASRTRQRTLIAIASEFFTEMYDRNALETYWAIGFEKKTSCLCHRDTAWRSDEKMTVSTMSNAFCLGPCRRVNASPCCTKHGVFFLSFWLASSVSQRFNAAGPSKTPQRWMFKPAVKSSQQSWCFRNPAFTNQLRLVDYPIIYKVLFIQTVGCEWDLSPTQLAVFSSLYTVYIYILPSFGGSVIPPITRKSIDKGIQSPGNFAFFPYWRWLKKLLWRWVLPKKERIKETNRQTDRQTNKASEQNKQANKRTNERTN